METTIIIRTKEAGDIIKKHVLKAMPLEVSNKDINVSNAYGDFTIEINEKNAEKDDENETA